MQITATLDEYKSAEQALLRLALPWFSNHRTFRISSSAFSCVESGAEAIRILDLKEKDFDSPEAFLEAQASPVIWMTDLFMDPMEDSEKVVKTAASSLKGVLGQMGEDPEVQRIACEAFQCFFGMMNLAFNAHLEWGYRTLEEFLKSENLSRKQRFPHYPLLFDDTPEQQTDLVKCLQHGVWTVEDQRETITLSAASTPTEALAKAWTIAPNLEPFRRLQALDEKLPAPRKCKPRTRF